MHCNHYSVKLPHLPGICIYCGDPANERDHVFPKSIFKNRGFKVWSCRECNGLAGDMVFDTVEDKGRYIRLCIRIKYDHVFDYPDWSDDEITELDYVMRTTVISGMRIQQWIMNRLRWETNLLVMIVVKFLENEGIGKDFVAECAAINGIRHYDLLSLIELD